MTRLLTLAARIRALKLDAAPAEVRDKLQLQTIAALAAAGAGRSFPGAGAVLDLLGCSDDGPVPILPGLAAPSLPIALEAAAMLSTAWGEDDLLLPARTGPLAWVALFGAADLGRDAEHALRAQAAGNELAARLSGFCLGTRRPLRSSGLVLTFGAAVTAGVLLDLPEPKLAHALALALARSSNEGGAASRSGARLLGPGRAVRLGWDCARLAERGLEGDLDVLDEVVDLLGGGKPLPGWWTGIGEVWLTQTLTASPLPGSPFLAPTLLALEELRADVLASEGRALKPADILRIDVDATLPTAAMELQLGRLAEARNEQDAAPPPAAFLHSVCRGVALSLALGRSPGADDLRPSALARSWPVARDLSRRIHVRHDWRLTLSAWEQLRGHVGIDRLMDGVGPSALVAAALRVRGRGAGGDGIGAAGPPGGGAGMAWSELPLALAAERIGPRGAELSEELIDDPAAAVGKGLEKLAGWASRRMERILDADGGPFARLGGRLVTARAATLDGARFDGMRLPIPARLRVLENGGRVWEAEVTHVAGADADVLLARCEARLGPAFTAAVRTGSPAAIVDAARGA